MTIQILVIGSAQAWRDGMVSYLRVQEMVVRTIDSAAALSRAVAVELPDVILLSDTLVRDRLQGSSVEMLTLLRQAAPRVPVVMLGTQADSMEKIICLECGADDYVNMPCNPRELLSRIRNILRYRPRPLRSAINPDGCCVFGDFVFNRSRLQLTRNGACVPLQESAMTLLGKLAEHPMKVLSRQTLIEMLHGIDDMRSARTIRSGLQHSAVHTLDMAAGGVSCERSLDVVVCRLRRVIETNPSQPKFLQTVRGFGYVFNPSGAPGTAQLLGDQDALRAAPRGGRSSVRGGDNMGRHKALEADNVDHAERAARGVMSQLDAARAINPWFSEKSFPTRYPAFEDPLIRSPA